MNKKIKVIDEMSKKFAEKFCFAPLNKKCNQGAKDFTNQKCINCIKEYFINKVKLKSNKQSQ